MTSVLLVDDHAVLRAGLRMLLNAQPDLKVVGEAATAAEALELVGALQPEVILLDISLPDKAGPKAAAALQEAAPGARLLVLTMHEDEAYLLEALHAGCAGYVVKQAADTELIAAIRAVHRGEPFVCSAGARVVVDRYLEAAFGAGRPRVLADAGGRRPAAGLTCREIEVLSFIAQGYTNKEIADLLFVSVKTVETHKAHLMEKLDLSGRAQLVRYALEHGLLPGVKWQPETGGAADG